MDKYRVKKYCKNQFGVQKRYFLFWWREQIYVSKYGYCDTKIRFPNIIAAEYEVDKLNAPNIKN